MALLNVADAVSTYTASGRINHDSLVEQYLPVVRKHALSMKVKLPASVEMDDLIQAGIIGLIEAMGRFDETVGASFQTFANQRIRGAMIDELRSRDWLPRSVRRKAREMDGCIRALEQQLGRPPSEWEICSTLGMDMHEYHKVLSDTNSGQILPLDELISEGGEPEDVNNNMATPFDALIDDEQRHLLIEAIEDLPEREKLLMALYYQEEMNLKEIGEILGVTESRVCQLHSQAISRLRSKLNA